MNMHAKTYIWTVMCLITVLLIGGTTMAMSDHTQQDLTQLGQQWAAAELHGDAAFLNTTLTDDYIGIGPRGFMLTKEQWLQRLTSGDLKYTAFTWDDVKLRVYGDAAIMTGRQAQEGQYKGRDIRGEFRDTLVFVRRHGHWQLAGLHISPIAGAP